MIYELFRISEQLGRKIMQISGKTLASLSKEAQKIELQIAEDKRIWLGWLMRRYRKRSGLASWFRRILGNSGFVILGPMLIFGVLILLGSHFIFNPEPLEPLEPVRVKQMETIADPNGRVKNVAK